MWMWLWFLLAVAAVLIFLAYVAVQAKTKVTLRFETTGIADNGNEIRLVSEFSGRVQGEEQAYAFSFEVEKLYTQTTKASDDYGKLTREDG
jgi:hypothetical protein